MLQFQYKIFNELTKEELYEILALRSAVFVVEQKSIYLDPDGRDPDAIHLLGRKNNQLMAYLRFLPPSENEEAIVLGRVLTAPEMRGKGQGKILIEHFMQYCLSTHPNISIKSSAQVYLIPFYESFGFKVCGERYDDGGIQHVEMTLRTTSMK